MLRGLLRQNLKLSWLQAGDYEPYCCLLVNLFLPIFLTNSLQPIKMMRITRLLVYLSIIETILGFVLNINNLKSYKRKIVKTKYTSSIDSFYRVKYLPNNLNSHQNNNLNDILHSYSSIDLNKIEDNIEDDDLLTTLAQAFLSQSQTNSNTLLRTALSSHLASLSLSTEGIVFVLDLYKLISLITRLHQNSPQSTPSDLLNALVKSNDIRETSTVKLENALKGYTLSLSLAMSTGDDSTKSAVATSLLTSVKLQSPGPKRSRRLLRMMVSCLPLDDVVPYVYEHCEYDPLSFGVEEFRVFSGGSGESGRKGGMEYVRKTGEGVEIGARRGDRGFMLDTDGMNCLFDAAGDVGEVEGLVSEMRGNRRYRDRPVPNGETYAKGMEAMKRLGGEWR